MVFWLQMRDENNNLKEELIILLEGKTSILKDAHIDHLGSFTWDSEKYNKYGIQADASFLYETYQKGNVFYDCFDVYLIRNGDRRHLISIFRPYDLWENDSLIELKEKPFI